MQEEHQKNELIKIFVSHRTDLDSVRVDNPLYVDVYCGAALGRGKDDTILGDDTGDHISSMKPWLSELTVMYWAWKNVEADYYGLCHYRRYMAFGHTDFPEDQFGNVYFERLEAETEERSGLLNERLHRKIITSYDFCYTDFDVRNVGYRNVYEQFAEVSVPGDAWDRAIDLFREFYPEDEKYAKEYLEGAHFYPCLLFVMRKEIFQAWCEWVFPYLFYLKDHISMENYSEEQCRFVAHVGERLLGVFLLKLKKEKPRYHGYCCQRLFFQQTRRKELLQGEVVSDKVLPVVMTASNEFFPLMSVTLQSLMDHAASDREYALILLTSRATIENKRRLFSQMSKYKNWRVSFIDIDEYMRLNSLYTNPDPNGKFSPMTYARLILGELLKEYPKAVYLDSDVLVMRDISELFDVNLAGRSLGAVRDSVMSSWANQQHHYRRIYNEEVLHMVSPLDYFNGGVLLLDIPEFRRRHPFKKLLREAGKNQFEWMDQDVLNKECDGDVMFLPLAWNFMARPFEQWRDLEERSAPRPVYEAYKEAYRAPAIIHYAGSWTPCFHPESPYADVYWSYARKTPFYEQLVRMESRQQSVVMAQLKDPNFDFSLYENIYDRFRFPFDIVPAGSRIVIYGGGVVGKMFLKQLARASYCQVVAICDQNPAGTGIVEAPVISVRKLVGMPAEVYDLILVAIERADIAQQIRQNLIMAGIPSQRIKWTDPHGIPE